LKDCKHLDYFKVIWSLFHILGAATEKARKYKVQLNVQKVA